MSIDNYAGGPGRGPASLLCRNRNDDFPAGAATTCWRPTATPPRPGGRSGAVVDKGRLVLA